MSDAVDECYRANDREFPKQYGEYVDGTFTGINITGAALTYYVKRHQNDETAEITRQNATAGGGSDEIEDVDLSTGRFRVKLVPANTSGLDFADYFWSVESVLAGVETTLGTGILRIKPNSKPV